MVLEGHSGLWPRKLGGETRGVLANFAQAGNEEDRGVEAPGGGRG